jgi:DNA-binding transcriptional regulator YiaG
MTPAEFREARRKLGLSAASLAALLSDRDEGGHEVNPRTIRRWEDGSQPVPGPAVVAVRLINGDYEASVSEDGQLQAMVNRRVCPKVT